MSAANILKFADLIDMIDRLPLDEQESLVDLVRRRIAEGERRRIAASIRSAKREHRLGKSKPASPDDLTRKILT